MKYFIYCRKSSEEEERQALSIESQLQELREYASKQGLNVVREYIESKSAKKPGREIFNKLLLEIEAGEADGILAWQPDRLSRNSVDGGKIIYLIDQGIIKDLKFPSYYFENTPHGKFNLSIAFGFSKMYVDRLSEDVKRGIREKIRRGEFPGKATLGYYNHPKTRKIEPNPTHFKFIKSLLERFAEGEISQTQIREEMYQAGFRTRNGNKPSFFSISHMLKNPFYYGVFRLKEELYQGTHQAMISKNTFDKIQKRLEKNPKKVNFHNHRNEEKEFYFQGLASCGFCGYAITKEWHKKKSGKVFKYYRCSRKSKTCTCKEKAINEKDLMPQVENLISQVSIPSEWYEKFATQIDIWVKNETSEAQEQARALKTEREAINLKLERLLDLELEGDISSEEYRSKKNNLVNKKSDLEYKINQIKTEGQIWVEPLKQFIETGHQAHLSVLDQNFHEMNRILKKVGLNQLMTSQNLKMDFIRPFNFLSEIHSQPKSSSFPDEKLNNKILKTQIQSGTSRKKDKRSLDASCVSAVSEPRSGELSEACVASRAGNLATASQCDSEWWWVKGLNLALLL
jgi:site-specific DNA recombinase